MTNIIQSEYVTCPACDTLMNFTDEFIDEYVCPNCGARYSADDIFGLNENIEYNGEIIPQEERPPHCQTCEGPYPACSLDCDDWKK